MAGDVYHANYPELDRLAGSFSDVSNKYHFYSLRIGQLVGGLNEDTVGDANAHDVFQKNFGNIRDEVEHLSERAKGYADLIDTLIASLKAHDQAQLAHVGHK